MKHIKFNKLHSPLLMFGILLSLAAPVGAQSAPMSEAPEAGSDPVPETIPEHLPGPDLPGLPPPNAEGDVPEMESPEKMTEPPLNDGVSEETSMPAEPETPSMEGMSEPVEEDEMETSETSEEPVSGNTLLNVLQADESYSTLVQAIEAAELTDSFNGEGKWTIFAPTNAAFEALPDGVLETLLQPENKSILGRILLHHVLQDQKLAADLSTTEVTSMANSPLQITVANGMVSVDDAKVVQADLTAENGVIHGIDKILVPQELKQ